MNRPRIRKCTRCTVPHWMVTDAGRVTDVPTWTEALATVARRAAVRELARQRRALAA